MSKNIKFITRVCAALLIFCMSCGVIFNPQPYLASTTSKSYICLEDDIVVVPYSFRTGYFDTTISSATIDTDCLRFRLWVYFGESIPEGSKVNVSLDLRSGVGSIGKVEGFFALPNGQDIYAQESLSSKLEIDYLGNGRLSPFVGTFELTGDASAFVVDVTYTSRTSTSIYLNVSNITLDCVIPDVVYEELKDLNTSSNSILYNIKSVVKYVGNLPGNIASSISGFFDSLGIYVVNGLSTAFDSLLSALPDEIEEALRSTLSNISSAISNVHTSISNLQETFNTIIGDLKGALTGDLKDLGSYILNLPLEIAEALSDFFLNFVDAIEGLESSIVGGMVDGLSVLFVPDDDFFITAYESFASKVPFVKVIVDFISFIWETFSVVGDGVCPEPYVMTVDYAGGSMSVTLLDLSWYKPFKSTGDLFLSAFIIVGFVWQLFMHLPSIINGVNNDAVKGITEIAKGDD